MCIKDRLIIKLAISWKLSNKHTTIKDKNKCEENIDGTIHTHVEMFGTGE